MEFDLLYILVGLIAIYRGIKTYIHTKNNLILWGLGILSFSVIVKIRGLNLGDYLIDITQIFWAIVDISRAIFAIYLFKYTYKLK